MSRSSLGTLVIEVMVPVVKATHVNRIGRASRSHFKLRRIVRAVGSSACRLLGVNSSEISFPSSYLILFLISSISFLMSHHFFHPSSLCLSLVFSICRGRMGSSSVPHTAPAGMYLSLSSDSSHPFLTLPLQFPRLSRYLVAFLAPRPPSTSFVFYILMHYYL